MRYLPWNEEVSSFKDRGDYLRKLCDSVGVVIRERTKGEKALGVMKGVGRLGLRSAVAGLKVTSRVVSNLADEPKPKRRRHRRHQK